ncbi:esterase family protein [Bacillus sp. HMF5848]|uniref:alpha/beta hydrolase n=1 Tax=Bacillus sp. HMF5848 TaxID=2495421 RepID=UPI000F76EB18|nr:alpha/beta hydrolase-fold protein [Bacillus sp. HMF5848]RSK26525.1 esterase family protein [Bacillus sp. HMF5848]
MSKTIGKQLYSKELQETIELIVHLPPRFSTLYKYDVLIVQDGQDYLQLGMLRGLTDSIFANSSYRPAVIVAIPYRDVTDRYEKYHPNGSKNNSYIRFLAHELVPYIDKEFPTYLMGSTRSLVGDSLAATVSLLTCLRYPHTFGNVILQSPYVNKTVLNTVKEWHQQHSIRMYHSIGKKEQDVITSKDKHVNFLEKNKQLYAQLVHKINDYQYCENQDGTHTWTTWQTDLSDALEFIYRDL